MKNPFYVVPGKRQRFLMVLDKWHDFLVTWYTVVMKPNKSRAKKVLFVGAICLCLTCASGCPQQEGSFGLFATPTPAPTPTPTPAPTPVPVIALVGAEDAASYTARVEHAVAEAGLEFECIEGGMASLNSFSPEGAASVIVYCSTELDDAAALSSRYPVFLCAASRQTVPQGVSNLCYDDDMAAVEALQLALDHPPHLAPVRMLGLFASKDGNAYGIWQKAVEDGFVMERGVLTPESDNIAAEVNDWLTGKLKGLYPGMLDCIYAETGELAVAAANALLGLGRADTEIFAAGTDGDVGVYLEQHPAIVVNAVGMDVDEAARISVSSAIALLTSRSVIERSLTPQVFPVTPAEP